MYQKSIDPNSIRGHLITYCNANFEPTENQKSICKIGSIRFLIRDDADLYIADEIFRGEMYCLQKTDPCVVIDIGMNVGLASLYFASKPQVKKIYAFEPFLGTYQMAVENFNLNPHLKDKIIPHAFGLFSCNQQRQVRYAPELRGIMTSLGPPASADNVKQELVDIELKSIGDIVRKIAAENQNLVLKMDCEGDEFQLVPSLDSEDLLKYFNTCMIEFHHQSPDALIAILERAGFSISSETASSQILFQSSGGNMIYATRLLR